MSTTFRIFAATILCGLSVSISGCDSRQDSDAAQKNAEMFDALLKDAEAGNAGAQFQLGGAYSFGVGVPQDSVEAVMWYRKSAEQGE